MKKIQLIQRWSASPVAEGEARLQVRIFSDRVEGWATSHYRTEPFELLFEQSGPYSWRSVVSEICEQEQVGTGEPVEISGASGVQAEMLVIAWQDDETRRLATALLELSDDQLAQLSEEAAGLAQASEAAELREQLDDVGHESPLGALDLSEEPSTRSLLERLGERVQLICAEAEESEEREAIERAHQEALVDQAVAPFAKQIRTVLDAWCESYHPSCRSLHGRARKAALERFIRQWVTSTGALPTGKQTIRYAFWNNAEEIDVDFDRLSDARDGGPVDRE